MQKLQGFQGLRAFMLARAYGHLWARALEEIAQERYGEGENAVKELLEDGVPIEEIAGRSKLMNESMPVPGLEAPYFDEEYGSITHITGSGRLTWEIATDGTVTFTVSRPFGDIIRAWVHDDGTWDAEYLAPADGGQNVRHRHILALEEAIRVLVPEADVVSMFPEVPSAPEAELAADVLEQVLKSKALARQKYIVESPTRITLEVSSEGWRVVDAKILVEQA